MLFTVLPFSAVAPDWSRAQVWVKSMKSGERKRLIENAVDAQYAGDNTLIFAREGKLFAIRFDPVVVVRQRQRGAGARWRDALGVRERRAPPGPERRSSALPQPGILFYAPGSVEPPLLTPLVWFDRTGQSDSAARGCGTCSASPRVSSRTAFGSRSSELYVNKDIWFFDTARGTEDRATFEGQNAFPIFSPTGSRFAFRSDRNGPQQIFLSEGVNLREVKRLTPGPFDVPSSWTPDGKELVFTRGFTSLGGNTDIYAVSVDQPDKVRAVVATPADERAPEISPDGKWLAYASNDSGNSEALCAAVSRSRAARDGDQLAARSIPHGRKTATSCSTSDQAARESRPP